MLEIRNVSKVYNIYNSSDAKEGCVNALYRVSLKFPEKGMVFVLGKSGSGKSTLLNIIGGLDTPTYGEIIIKNKNCTNFSKSDFDSYRNTFIGFVFQEYNVIDELTVEQNVTLSVELQGKKVKKRKKEIKEILKKVGLDGVAKRKPNSLSGGQRQRIAIARALVKNPEVILADEPTGALDYNTGIQVLDILKELSKEKLVIVVSHDRDFAVRYADRIIELSDGKISSDTTQENVNGVQVSENLTIIEDDTVCIKNGSAISNGEFDVLKTFFKESKNVFITRDEEDIKKYKKVTGITDDGNKKKYRSTRNSDIEIKQYKEKKLIRSRLKLKRALIIGASSLKYKKFRLTITILAITIAFVLLNMFTAFILFDMNGACVANIQKYEYVHTETTINNTARDSIKSTYGNNVIYANSQNYPVEVEDHIGRTWDIANINWLSYLEEGHSFRNNIKIGKYPTNPNEICVSKYYVEHLKNLGICHSDTKEVINEDNVLGKVFNINGIRCSVVGVFEGDDYYKHKDKNSIAKLILVDESRINENALYAIIPTKDIDFSQIETNGTLYGEIAIDSNFLNQALLAEKTITNFYDILLYGGGVMLLLVILLMTNFIAISISHKKKQIGILRAIGARTIDVFKIFFLESLVITTIGLSLSVILTIIISNYLNTYLKVSVLFYGLMHVLIVLGVALLLAIIVTVLPIKSISNKKPADAIRSL